MKADKVKRGLLRYTYNMYAKKSLGQHFLKSEKALSQIVAASNPSEEDVVLEIGPGQGALTDRLLSYTKKVIAVEKDADLIPLLHELFEIEITEKRFELLHQDILKFDPDSFFVGKNYPYKLVANIPYYITGAIIEKFLSCAQQPSTMVLLMQKEVAERIIARDKKESILSIAIKAYGVPKLIGKVPPGAFVPPPTVDSAILSIENITRDFFTGPNGCDEKLFFTVLKKVFGQKRKQIGGMLTEFLDNKELALLVLHQSSIDTKTRPEDMSLETWKTLTQTLVRNS